MNFKDSLGFKGIFRLRLERAGKIITDIEIPNGVTDQGANRILDLFFLNLANTTWDIGLIDNAGFTAVAASDTAASHAGWSQLVVSSPATDTEIMLPAIQNGANGAIVTQDLTSPNFYGAKFVITSAGTLKGVYRISTPGTFLWATAILAGTLALSVSDVLWIQYTVACTTS